MSIWTEHRNPEGRTYWFNTGTRESVWEKPDDLKTPFERALNQTKWKEYFSGGRKYYYNTETKESKWEMPDELILVLEKVEKDTKAAPSIPAAGAPSFTPGVGGPMQGALVPLGGADPSSSVSQHTSPLNGTDGAVGPHTGGLPFAPSSILPARPNLPDDPVIPHNGFMTVEEGEKAFIHLLKKAGVDANWTWDQTMRAIITDPLYKALNTLAEKKAAWQKFTDALKAKEHEEKEARLAKFRPAIRNMLKGNPNVFHYTTFATADKLFAQHPIWQQARVEAERKLIFEEYVAELKQREVQESRAARSRSISKVVALFKELNVDVTTRWRKAQELVMESDEWRHDQELQKLPTLDVLLAFEDYSRVREREFEEQMRRAQVEKTRKERKAREAFKALLQDLVKDGKIKARTKWKAIYPTFSDDERYLNMLGNTGSNPLELFWDVVDNLDQDLDRKLALVEEAIRKHNAELKAGAKSETDENAMKVDEKDDIPGFAVGPDTNEDEFLTVLKAEKDGPVTNLTDEDLHAAFQTLHELALKKQADERRRAERKQRHLQDDLRYALRKLPEPLDLSISYETAVPLIEHLPEYKALDDEDARRAAFSKFVKRQKERLREAASEDGGSTTSRKRKEPTRDHDRDRDRDHRDKDRARDHEKEPRSSRYTHRDEHDSHGRRSSRDYVKERARSKDYAKDVDKERDYKSSRHHRDADRDDRKRKSAYSREWEEHPHAVPPVVEREERARSTSVYRDEVRDKHYDDRLYDDRSEKRPRYDEPDTAEFEGKPEHVRAETPEEGEI
ncbi:hypothetical protein PLICRDRAFT_43174 [Plicaturopsis crispa FD-325 SS-3]|nr:hypothetical protein PLICRDRAFT_43174 [Plicaturopsis crispa FD-325 SS-3]